MNSRLRKSLCSILSLLIVSSMFLVSSCSIFGGDAKEKAKEESKDDSEKLADIDFALFSDSVTSDSLTFNLTIEDPEALDIAMDEVTFGDVDKDSYLEKTDKYTEYQDQLEEINYDNLTEQEQIEYDVIEYDLNEALAYEDYFYYSSPFNSITGIQSNLPLIMPEYEFVTTEDIDDYLLLLTDFYRYYQDLMTVEQERADKGFGASDTVLDAIIESCQSFLDDEDNSFLISSFAENLEDVEGLTDEEKEAYIEQNQSILDEYVFPAYQLLIDGFTDLKGQGENDGGLCNFENGKEYYELLLKTQTSSDMSVEDAISYVDDAIDGYIDVITETNTDDDFWALYGSYSFSMGTIQENLDYCESAITEDYPEIMDHNVTLKEVPEALQDYFSPAAYLSCKIDDPSENLIITNPSAMDGDQNVLETIAHEGYPGHMYEAIYHAEHIASYYQRTASFIGYSEGWAECAGEDVLKNAGYDEDLVNYVYAENKILNVLIPARIDIGVNYEAWTYDDCIDYIEQYGLSEAYYSDYAQYCYDRAIEIPCYVMPYCFGYLQTKEIFENTTDSVASDVTQKDIHEAYLDIGAAPFPIIEKYMDEFIENNE